MENVKPRIEDVTVDGTMWAGIAFIEELPIQLIEELGLSDYVDTTRDGHIIAVEGSINTRREDGNTVISLNDTVTLIAPNGQKIETFLSDFFDAYSVDADVAGLFDYNDYEEGA